MIQIHIIYIFVYLQYTLDHEYLTKLMATLCLKITKVKKEKEPRGFS